MYEFLDRRYALALYEICDEVGNVELVLEQFREIVDEIDSNKDFLKIIKNPQISKSNKKRIFRELFEKNIEGELLNFLLLTIEKERILYLREKYKQFRDIYLSASNIIRAEVKSTIQLNDEEKEKLKLILEKKYNKVVILKEKVDKTLIGGVIIRVGDEIIDGSIKKRVSEVRDIAKEAENGDNISVERNQSRRKLYNRKEESLKANVTTVVPLTEEERGNLLNSLELFYDRKIELIENIDEKLIGGIVVKIGEDVIDCTIKNKLKHIQQN